MSLQDYLDQRDVGARQYDGNSPQGKFVFFFFSGDVSLGYDILCIQNSQWACTNNFVAWFIPDIDIMGMAAVQSFVIRTTD